LFQHKLKRQTDSILLIL